MASNQVAACQCVHTVLSRWGVFGMFGTASGFGDYRLYKGDSHKCGEAHCRLIGALLFTVTAFSGDGGITWWGQCGLQDLRTR